MTLAACMALAAAGCGNSDKPKQDVKEWVYVPEFVTIGEDGEDVNYYNMQYVNGGLCYPSYDWDEETQTSSMSVVRYSLEDKSTSKVTLSFGDESKNASEDTRTDRNINNIAFGSDGSIYGVVYVYPNSESGEYVPPKQSVAKFDSQGKLVWETDMTERMNEDPENSYMGSLTVDGQGRAYVFSNSLVWLLDADGAYKGSVSVGAGGNSWIQAAGCGGDGNVYVSVYSYDGNSTSNNLTAIDFEAKKTGTSYASFPGGNGETLTADRDNNFYVNDGTKVWTYDLKTQTKTALFDWLDSDINGSNVRSVGVMEDGRLVAAVEDWDEGDSYVALLTKTPGSEVAQKETIVLATLGNGYSVQAAAVKFNRANDKYHITIREYMDYDNYSQETFNNAIANLNNDITSKSNCPDIIDLSGLNIKQLVSKGVLVDMNQFLEKSSTLKRSDLVESVLDAYTYNDVLAFIPSGFSIGTVIGRPSDVGTEMGWTVKELMEFAQAHPDSELFDRTPKASIMYYLMAYNEDAFIDWSTGKCNFDSEEFKNLLTFVNNFPDEIDWESQQASTPTRIQNGEVLLDMAYFYNFDEIQMYYEIFGGDINCIGYPTVDGSAGTIISPNDMFAISAKSENRDAAWQFIESYLTQKESRYSWGFPILKAKLDEMAKEAVKIEYGVDGNGESYIIGTGGSMGYQDGWSYTYRKATQEEVDLILFLIDVAKPASNSNSEMMTIINEEAEGFFKGQKSVDEVAKIIQSRIQVYVSENK